MIQLINCGYHYVHEDGLQINRPCGSGNYAFVFFKSASEVVLQDVAITLAPNSYICLRPGTSHLYRELEKPFVNDWFHCADPALEEFLTEVRFPLDTPIPAEDPYMISRSIRELQYSMRHNSPLQDRIVDCDLRSFFMKLSVLHEKSAILEKSNRHFRQFSRLRSDLYASPVRSVTVDSLAASLNLSKPYFQHIYKELFGCSVVTDIIHARLEHAKYLLSSSHQPICAISKMCGYENDTHFMRQFKKFVGVTPSQYKSGQNTECLPAVLTK